MAIRNNTFQLKQTNFDGPTDRNMSDPLLLEEFPYILSVETLVKIDFAKEILDQLNQYLIDYDCTILNDQSELIEDQEDINSPDTKSLRIIFACFKMDTIIFLKHANHELKGNQLIFTIEEEGDLDDSSSFFSKEDFPEFHTRSTLNSIRSYGPDETVTMNSIEKSKNQFEYGEVLQVDLRLLDKEYSSSERREMFLEHSSFFHSIMPTKKKYFRLNSGGCRRGKKNNSENFSLNFSDAEVGNFLFLQNQN